MPKVRLIATLLGAVAVAGLAIAAAAQAPAYTVTRAVPLGAPDRWDYVVYDAASHRVFVAHGDVVSVVDGRSGAVVGTIEGMPGGTHGIGISTVTGRGYTDDGRAGEAVAFDLKTLKTGEHIKADADADGIAFDPKSGHVFIVNGVPSSLTVIDPKTNTAIATIDGGGKLEYAVADGAGGLYVNGEAKHEIVHIDTGSNTVLHHWPMDGCTSPHGLAIDLVAKRLFSTCTNGVMVVMDATSGRIVATLPIGKGSDAAAFDPKFKRAFSSNGVDGTVTVVQETGPDSFTVTGTVTTAVTGRTMTVDPATGRLFIAAADVDPASPAGGRPRPAPGSLKLLFLDPKP
jgi:YVTN family beta-propeller protein